MIYAISTVKPDNSEWNFLIEANSIIEVLNELHHNRVLDIDLTKLVIVEN